MHKLDYLAKFGDKASGVDCMGCKYYGVGAWDHCLHCSTNTDEESVKRNIANFQIKSKEQFQYDVNSFLERREQLEKELRACNEVLQKYQDRLKFVTENE